MYRLPIVLLSVWLVQSKPLDDGLGGLVGELTPRTGPVWPPFPGAGQGYWARKAGFYDRFEEVPTPSVPAAVLPIGAPNAPSPTATIQSTTSTQSTTTETPSTTMIIPAEPVDRIPRLLLPWHHLNLWDFQNPVKYNLV